MVAAAALASSSSMMLFLGSVGTCYRKLQKKFHLGFMPGSKPKLLWPGNVAGYVAQTWDLSNVWVNYRERVELL
jgi:hypothetical protein